MALVKEILALVKEMLPLEKETLQFRLMDALNTSPRWCRSETHTALKGIFFYFHQGTMLIGWL